MGNNSKGSPSALSSGWALPKALTSESRLLDSHLYLRKNALDKWNHGNQLSLSLLKSSYDSWYLALARCSDCFQWVWRSWRQTSINPVFMLWDTTSSHFPCLLIRNRVCLWNLTWNSQKQRDGILKRLEQRFAMLAHFVVVDSETTGLCNFGTMLTSSGVVAFMHTGLTILRVWFTFTDEG